MSHEDGQISSTPTASEPPKASHSSDYAPYPKLDPTNVTPPPPPPSQPVSATTMPPESNPYVSPSPAPMNMMDTVKDSLGKWGKMAADATKKAEDLAGNVWQHSNLSSILEKLRSISRKDQDLYNSSNEASYDD